MRLQNLWMRKFLANLHQDFDKHEIFYNADLNSRNLLFGGNFSVTLDSKFISQEKSAKLAYYRLLTTSSTSLISGRTFLQRKPANQN